MKQLPKAVKRAIDRLHRLYAGYETYYEVYGVLPTELGCQQRDERLVLDYVIAEYALTPQETLP